MFCSTKHAFFFVFVLQPKVNFVPLHRLRIVGSAEVQPTNVKPTPTAEVGDCSLGYTSTFFFAQVTRLKKKTLRNKEKIIGIY